MASREGRARKSLRILVLIREIRFIICRGTQNVGGWRHQFSLSHSFRFVSARKQNHAEPQYPDLITRFGCSRTGRVGMLWGIMWANAVF